MQRVHDCCLVDGLCSLFLDRKTSPQMFFGFFVTPHFSVQRSHIVQRCGQVGMSHAETLRYEFQRSEVCLLSLSILTLRLINAAEIIEYIAEIQIPRRRGPKLEFGCTKERCLGLVCLALIKLNHTRTVQNER